MAGTGKLLVDTGGGFTEIPMIENTPNNYEAVFPVVDCGTPVAFRDSTDPVVQAFVDRAAAEAALDLVGDPGGAT